MTKRSKIYAVDEGVISLAAEALLAGKLIGLPTETVYGLAARADDDASVNAIFAAKGRPRSNPLILHVADLADAIGLFAPDLDEVTKTRLMRLSKLWPGPLTVIGPRHHDVLDSVTAGGDTVAVRIPRHLIAIDVLRAVKQSAGHAVPIAAPSANVSNYISPTTAAHVESGLGEHVELILDGGACEVGLESTIVYLGTSQSSPKLLRQGHYGSDELEDCLGEPLELNVVVSNDPKPVAAPGQFAKHYSPKTPLVLVSPDTPISKCQKTLRIDFCSEAETTSLANHWTFTPDGDLATAANRLYDVLRKADADGFQQIEVAECPKIGIGIAIMDRLQRAASHQSLGDQTR